ncbi:hypothetical protein PLESTF_001244900 [Pleodorina starrii]|nr:hypothetical protein PLESTF_001244900 [Pleodorina starrii]
MSGTSWSQSGAGVTRSSVRPGVLSRLVGAVWSVEQAVEGLLVDHWTPNRIPDLSGKLALVTGGNSGIGLEVCRKLVENCATVLLVSRDKQRGEEAAAQIRASLMSQGGSGPGSGTISERIGRIVVLQADLLSLRDVQRLIGEVKRHTREAGGLHMLLCNAALFQPGAHAVSSEGLEQTLAVDYYSHVELTLGLLEELTRGSERGGGARVVLQASQAEAFGSLDFNNLKASRPPVGDKFTDSGMSAYGSAKLWMLMFAEELQRRLRAGGGAAARIDVFGVHPGLVDSPLMDKADTQRHLNAALIVMQNMFLGMPTWRGSLPALYALTEPSLAGKGFQYIGPNWFNLHMLGVRSPGNRLWRTGGPELRSRLFEETASLLQQLGHPPAHLPKPAAALAT